MGNRWIKINPAGNIPNARSGTKSCVSLNEKYIYFFGGYTFRKGMYFNDLVRFDIETHTWETLSLKGDKISGRVDHSCINYNNKIYIFGGR
jgi:leucine-zipper-like transcriptional regulator 1